MEAEYIIFETVQRAAADQTKVRQILLVLAAEGHAIVLAMAELEIYAAQMLFLSRQVAEASVTNAKDGSKNTVTRNFPIVASRAQSVTMAMRARRFCKRDCL